MRYSWGLPMRDHLIRLKFWLYEHSGSLTVLAAGAFGLAGALSILPLPATGAALATVLGIGFGAQKQKLEELEAFRRLFREYNARYDELDDQLRVIAAAPLN